MSSLPEQQWPEYTGAVELEVGKIMRVWGTMLGIVCKAGKQ